MATQPGGAPYPLGTDHVVDGDDAIKALAAYADITHSEYQGNGTVPNGQTAYVGNWVFSPATSWGNLTTIVGTGADVTVNAGGLIAIYAAVRFGSAIAARAFAEVQVNNSSVGRGIGGNSDDQLFVAIPAVLIGSGIKIQIVAYQASPVPQSVFVTLRVTRLGPGKPAGATTLLEDHEAEWLPVLYPIVDPDYVLDPNPPVVDDEEGAA